jgi:hypothetical protein
MKKEIGIDNGIGIENDNEKSPQLRTENVAFSSLRRENNHFTLGSFSEVMSTIKIIK